MAEDAKVVRPPCPAAGAHRGGPFRAEAAETAAVAPTRLRLLRSHRHGDDARQPLHLGLPYYDRAKIDGLIARQGHCGTSPTPLSMMDLSRAQAFPCIGRTSARPVRRRLRHSRSSWTLARPNDGGLPYRGIRDGILRGLIGGRNDKPMERG